MTGLTAPLIVCAAPGSATAPLAEALAEAGLFSGGQVRPGGLAADDEHMAALQRAVLSDGGPPTAARWQAEARALLAQKFSGHPAWGWRDARTAFLLDLWNAVLPEARWLFVYRSPAVAVWSLLRRGVFARESALPWRRALRAGRTWRAANRRIVAFAAAHRDRCLVLRAPDDYDEVGEASVREALARWGVALEPLPLAATFRPHLVKRRAPRWLTALTRALPGTVTTLRQLDALRDRRPRPEGASRHPRTVCVFAPELKRQYSQTFVHDHLTRLPARTVLLHQEGRGTLLTQDDLPLLTPLERLASAILREFAHGSDALRDRALARFLRRERADAVLVEFGEHATALVNGCRTAGVPMIVHFHGFDAYRHELLRQKQDDYPVLFASAAAVIAVSRDMERQLARIGAPAARVHYNPCGVDVSLFHGADPSAAPPTFVGIGRFVDKKGPHLTLLAFRAVRAACPQSRLILIGDGPLLATCRSLAQQLGLEGSVEFPGARPHLAVLRVLRTARAFVQHSVLADGDSEGTPVAVLEAASCGVPVIATRHAGIPDVVQDGENGYLVAEGDTAAMAGHMIALAGDPALAATLGRRARERVVAEFAMEHSIRRLWRVIEDAMAPASVERADVAGAARVRAGSSG